MTAQYRHSRDVTCPSYLQASYLQLEYLDWLKEGRYGSVHAGVIYNTGIRTLYTEKMRYDSGIGYEIRESVATRIYITGSDVFLIEGESQMHSRCATEMVRGEEGGGGGAGEKKVGRG